MSLHSNVLLGIPDEVISSLDDRKDGWTTNKFGGTPNWIQGAPVEYPQCNLCNALLPLVTQIYCPLENSVFHRVLYIFGCTNTSCWNKKQSWKVFRCQLKVDNTQEVKAPKIKEKDSWCDEADEWGEVVEEATENGRTSPLEQLEQQTRELHLNSTRTTNGTPQDGHHCSKTHSKQFKELVPFVPYYITVIEESQLSFEANTTSRYEKKLLAEYQKREGLGDVEEMLEASGQPGWGNEKYERGVVKHGDKNFQKFQKQLNLCQKQCLRYSKDGEPLLMSSQTLGEIPPCPLCGQRRVFEIQLMPALVLLLRCNRKTSINLTAEQNPGNSVETHKDQCMQSEHGSEEAVSGSQDIEFGTVFVYTCLQSCWSDDVKFREEYVVVHADPDQHFFNSKY